MSKVQMAKAGKQRAIGSMAAGSVAPGVPQPIGAIKDAVNRAMDLGNGLYLIEFKPDVRERTPHRRPATVRKPQKLPGIAAFTVDAIADAMRSVQVVDHQPHALVKKAIVKKGAPTDPMPAANSAFMANFAEKEHQALTQLEQKGSLIDSLSLAERLQMTRQGVNKAAQEQRMFSITGAGGNKLFPAFFADSGLERKQLETVCRELGHLAGTSKWQFFTTPRLSLGRKSPIEALRKGKYAEVLAAAKAFKEA